MSSHEHISNQASHRRHTRSPILRLFSFLTDNIVARCLFPTASGSSGLTQIDSLTKGSVMGGHFVRVGEEPGNKRGENRGFVGSVKTANRSRIGRVTATIDTLPDGVLLEIFNFYLIRGPDVSLYQARKWHTLVHVCRRWRNIVFASPRTLDLHIHCTARTHVKEMLDIWPIAPIEICCGWSPLATFLQHGGVDNIIAALEHNERVCQIDLDGFPGLLLDRVTAAMQKPFPDLTHLSIVLWEKEWLPVIPVGFLDGSAPRLRSCVVGGIQFPGIWELLLTANRLVILHLNGIPPSTTISPEAMVTFLSMMPNLEQLWLLFLESHWPDQASRHPPPPTHIALPALTRFQFHGDSEYMEDLCSRIDAPLLDDFRFSFFFGRYDTPRICDFVNRTKFLEANGHRPLKYYDGPWG